MWINLVHMHYVRAKICEHCAYFMNPTRRINAAQRRNDFAAKTIRQILAVMLQHPHQVPIRFEKARCRASDEVGTAAVPMPVYDLSDSHCPPRITADFETTFAHCESSRDRGFCCAVVRRQVETHALRKRRRVSCDIFDPALPPVFAG